MGEEDWRYTRCHSLGSKSWLNARWRDDQPKQKTGKAKGGFYVCHWESKMSILQEGPEPLPQCDQCGIQMQADSLFKHQHSDKCHKLTERRLHQRNVEMAAMCGEI